MAWLAEVAKLSAAAAEINRIDLSMGESSQNKLKQPRYSGLSMNK